MIMAGSERPQPVAASKVIENTMLAGSRRTIFSKSIPGVLITTPLPPIRLAVPGVTWIAVTPMFVFTRYDGNHGSTA